MSHGPATDDSLPLGGPALASGALRDFSLRGVCAIPQTAKALSLNVTVTAPSSTVATKVLLFGPGQMR